MGVTWWRDVTHCFHSQGHHKVSTHLHKENGCVLLDLHFFRWHHHIRLLYANEVDANWDGGASHPVQQIRFQRERFGVFRLPAAPLDGNVLLLPLLVLLLLSTPSFTDLKFTTKFDQSVTSINLTTIKPWLPRKTMGAAWQRARTGASRTGATARRDPTTWQTPLALRPRRPRTKPTRTAASSWSATAVGGCPSNGPPSRDVVLRSAPALPGSPRRTPTHHPSNYSSTSLQHYSSSFLRFFKHLKESAGHPSRNFTSLSAC